MLYNLNASNFGKGNIQHVNLNQQIKKNKYMHPKVLLFDGVEPNL